MTHEAESRTLHMREYHAWVAEERRADDLAMGVEAFDDDDRGDEAVAECPICRGAGVLPNGPRGEEPECRHCGGGGEVYEIEEEDSRWTN